MLDQLFSLRALLTAAIALKQGPDRIFSYCMHQLSTDVFIQQQLKFILNLHCYVLKCNIYCQIKYRYRYRYRYICTVISGWS